MMMNLLVNTLGGWMTKHVSFGSEVAPIVLVRFSMYKNQARVAEEKENEANDRETTTIEREKVVKRRDEKAKVRERIAKEKLYNYKFALVVSWVFFFCFLFLFLFFVFCFCFCFFFFFWIGLAHRTREILQAHQQGWSPHPWFQ